MSAINSVQYILKNQPVPLDQKCAIKERGRPTPDLDINNSSISCSRTYNRVFNRNVYDKYEWICGCPVTNKMFCFVCLLFRKDALAWTYHGVKDLKHLNERAKKHEESVQHLNACMDFNVLGKVDLRKQLNSVYLQHKWKHNENVEKNRHILRRLIICIRFCGAFELERRSDSQDIYVGLINFASELDSALAIHLQNATVFKNASKTIQKDLLDAMYQVYKSELIKQIKSANFIALQADETTDSSNQQQMVIIIRYFFKGEICERFWSFAKPDEHTADHLADVLLAEIQQMLEHPLEKFKLVAQSYDGASVMSDNDSGVQAIIRTKFPCAYFVHCYAHQFDLIMEQAAQCRKRLKIFFAYLQSFANFFSRSPKPVAVLDEVVRRRLPNSVPTRWNFETRTVNTLSENIDAFRECLEIIVNGDRTDPKTLNDACGLLNNLQCPEFLYWLKLFSFIMPHVEIFFNEVQTSSIESVQLQNAVDQFERQLFRIRSITSNIAPEDVKMEEPAGKRVKLEFEGDTKSIIAQEVCDKILTQIKDRFAFKGHLSAAKLFDSNKFKAYRRTFPTPYFDDAVTYYPMLNEEKLKIELTAIYARDDMCAVDGVLPLLIFITDNKLVKVFSETYTLLDIICTTPMSTGECGRCFSTLKRIKAFLRTTVTEDRLDALTVLSVEKKFIQSIPDFDNKVIEVFCNATDRRKDFMYM